MAYAVKEMFYSLQGEGLHAGRPAVFVRFAGCNLWSGKEHDRWKGGCASWCDTDFVGTDGPGGGKYEDATALMRAIGRLWRDWSRKPYVVLTGGEPTLQVDAALCEALRTSGEVAIETNGTKRLPRALFDWVTLSPKAGAKVVLRVCDELKLVYPQGGCSPEEWEEFQATYRFLQPMWSPSASQRSKHVQACVRYCLDHPRWRLGLQTHKEVGVQ